MAWHTLASDSGIWGEVPEKFDPLARVSSVAAQYKPGCGVSQGADQKDDQAHQLAAALVNAFAATFTWTSNGTSINSLELQI